MTEREIERNRLRKKDLIYLVLKLQKKNEELLALINAERKRQEQCDDIHLKKIADIEKENADLQQKYLEESFEKAKLVKENAELKEKNEANENGAKMYAEFYFDTNNQLTKAKDLLKKFLKYCGGTWDIPVELEEEAEQFIKEIEE